MIETSNPEIDVNELMERVRREAAMQNEHRTSAAPRMPPNPRATLPKFPDLQPLPLLGLSNPFDARKEQLVGLLEKTRKNYLGQPLGAEDPAELVLSPRAIQSHCLRCHHSSHEKQLPTQQTRARVDDGRRNNKINGSANRYRIGKQRYPG